MFGVAVFLTSILIGHLATQTNRAREWAALSVQQPVKEPVQCFLTATTKTMGIQN